MLDNLVRSCVRIFHTHTTLPDTTKGRGRLGNRVLATIVTTQGNVDIATTLTRTHHTTLTTQGNVDIAITLTTIRTHHTTLTTQGNHTTLPTHGNPTTLLTQGTRRHHTLLDNAQLPTLHDVQGPAASMWRKH